MIPTTDSESPARLPRRPRRLLLGCVAIAISIAAMLEIAARVAFESPLKAQEELRGMFGNASDGKLRSNPGFRGEVELDGRTVKVELDDLGLRSAPLPARGDECRLLFLGDSWVFGHGVAMEETYPSRIADMLTDQLPFRVIAANAGVPGYGTLDQVGALGRLLEPVDPDVIVASIYLGNDFLDDSVVHRFVWDGITLTGPWARLMRRSLRARLMLRSRFLLWMEVALMNTGSRFALNARPSAEEAGAFLGFPPELPRNQRHACLFMDASDPAMYARPDGQSIVELALDRVERSVRDMMTLAGDRPLLVVISPSWWHLHLADRQDVMIRVLLDVDQHPPGTVQTRLGRRLDSLGVAWCDASAFFPEEDADLAPLFLSDRHLSPAGHECMASRLAPVLRSLLRE